MDDNGCPSTGLPLYWATGCVSYSVQRDLTQSLDPVEVRNALQKSFLAWSDLECGEGKGRATLTFSALEDVICKRSEYNAKGANVNIVLFQDNDWRYRGIDGTLAKTVVTFDDRTGEIYDADIEVNAAFNDLTVSDEIVSYDLQSIMTHEVGHFIGIAHSPEPEAAMYASYAPGSLSPRTLKKDDVDALCSIYPSDRQAVCDVVPRGGLSTRCDPPPEQGVCRAAPVGPQSRGEAPLALAAVALVLGLSARRRS